MREKINNYLKNRNKIAEDLIEDINIGFDNNNNRLYETNQYFFLHSIDK